ncbi:helix-turn-helix domain-containing protein [Acetobacterium bakii]|uniref:HTH araC/xylS-type domain-containing protein n=1 Tax=Acetobacterium bakii TaxID=52689 RepID=A0A0L6TVD2_9FIRM|nr:AraC family transcriptional regulator [Acetobacterium bakii]KNZ40234.1 hypothetical protein AKG39_18675 [Acetobacterium bakii]
MRLNQKEWGLKILKEDGLQIVYGLDQQISKSRIAAYSLYDGIEIQFMDFKEAYTWSGEVKNMPKFYQISFCDQGIYQMELKKNIFTYVSPGDIGIFNNCRSSLASKMIEDSMRGFSLLIYPELLPPQLLDLWKKEYNLDLSLFFEQIEKINNVQIFACGDNLCRTGKMLYEGMATLGLGFVRLKLIELFLMIIQEDYKIFNHRRCFSKEQIDKTKAIKKVIETDLSVHHTISALCLSHGISATIFKECFKEMFQFTPYEYLRKMRMNRAAHDLTHTDLSILEIGLMLGYENASNFTRAFKKNYGLLPKAFRKKSHQQEKCPA